jgi:hypothetical protein
MGLNHFLLQLDKITQEAPGIGSTGDVTQCLRQYEAIERALTDTLTILVYLYLVLPYACRTELLVVILFAGSYPLPVTFIEFIRPRL